jgi:hypothetical protein
MQESVHPTTTRCLESCWCGGVEFSSRILTCLSFNFSGEEEAGEQQQPAERPASVEQQLIQHLVEHTEPPPQPAAAAQSSEPETATSQPEQQPGEVRTESVAQQ